MASVQQQIQEASSRNATLLKTLSETDYASPALTQQNGYIGDLESSLKKTNSDIEQLTKQREKELEEHEKYRDSHFKRFAYRMGRKTEEFDEQASKEEREYFDALEQEHRAKEHAKALESQLEEARRNRDDLKKPAADNAEAQKELDTLYHSIFEGKKPGFPGEDAAEQNFHEVREAYATAQANSSAEHEAVKILMKAQHLLGEARHNMSSARDASRVDMLGGGILTDMVERDKLSSAQDKMGAVSELVAQAQRQSQAVHPLRQTQIAEGHLMGDVLFDNIFSDMKFHDQIKESQSDVERTAQDLEAQIVQAKERAGQLDRQLEQVSKKLGEARGQLQTARSRAFEKVAGGAA